MNYVRGITTIVRRSVLLLVLVAANLPAETPADSNGDVGRKRIAIDTNWRFMKQAMNAGSGTVAYDEWPDAESGDNDDRNSNRSRRQLLLKPWILPTGNDFVRDAKNRHPRPPGDPGSDLPYVQRDFDDSGWQEVTLPHDWAIAGPFIEDGPYGGMGRLPSRGVGWYRRKLDIPAGDAKRSIFLDVDGAMAYSAVWLNGHLVGGWPYGYNSWRLNLTPYLNAGGSNQLAIRLDNPPASSRWYPGGGLYRNVWLIKTASVHVGHWGTFVTTPEVSAAAASIRLEVTVDNDGSAAAHVSVVTDIHELDDAGNLSRKPVASIPPVSLEITAGASKQTSGSVELGHPRLWGPPPEQQPNRYVAVTRVLQGRQTLDRFETPFGIRDLHFDADSGVTINGKLVKLHGVNLHHDLGALGAAFNVRAAERQLNILRDMGANAIRMSHNPPAPEFLELADKMGFLVVDEIFDVWQRQKTPLDFHLIFDDWHEQDLRAFLRRDRNHPSVFLWSVGNEVGEQHTGAAGATIGRMLVDIAHEEDPTRLVTASLNWADADMPLPAAMDVISLNYQGVGVRTLPSDFPAYRRQFPNKVIFSSESAAALSTRGAFQFPVSGSSSGPVRPGIGGNPATAEVSAYELYAADFGSSADKSFSLHDQYLFVAGEFVWSGFDYLGEPTPYYSARSSYFGIVDLAGFPKDRFYLYQSHWRPDLPMAHILPHWSWPEREGEVTPVHVFTSGDEAELFLNGVSQGRREKAPFQYRLRWDYVKYEPGELKVVAYKNGEQWVTASVTTAGEPAALELTADRRTIAANGQDLAFVTLRVTDAHGRTAPRAAAPIAFSLDGPGEIVATDNGDPTDFTAFPSHDRRAFYGLALVIVRGQAKQGGTITLHAESDALPSASIVIDSVLLQGS